MVPAGAHETGTDRQGEIRREIDRLKDELDEAAAAESHLLADLRVSRHAKADLDADVAQLDVQLAAARAQLASAEASLEAALARHQAAGRSLERAQAALRGARSVLQEQAIVAFTRRGGGASELDIVLRVKDLRELHEARAYMALVARHQSAVVDEHRALEGDIRDLTDELQAAADDALAQRDGVEAQAGAVEAARREQDAARDAAAVEVARQEALLAQIDARQADYQRRIATLRQESETIAALLRRRQAGQGITTCSGGRLAAPLQNGRVTSRFGYRTHPIFGTRRLHTGIDFGAASGTPILAAAAGEVVYAGWQGGYGNAVVIDHGGSLATLYAHQSGIGVRTGQRVAQGQAIGRAGSTGFSTGPHLHFEVRVNGTPVDPLGCL